MPVDLPLWYRIYGGRRRNGHGAVPRETIVSACSSHTDHDSKNDFKSSDTLMNLYSERLPTRGGNESLSGSDCQFRAMRSRCPPHPIPLCVLRQL